MARRIEATKVAVADSATQLVAADPRRGTLVIHNMGGADIFVGPSNVAITTGLPVPNGEKVVFYRSDGDLGACAAFYAIAASAQASPADTRMLATYEL